MPRGQKIARNSGEKEASEFVVSRSLNSHDLNEPLDVRIDAELGNRYNLCTFASPCLYSSTSVSHWSTYSKVVAGSSNLARNCSRGLRPVSSDILIIKLLIRD